MVKDVKSLKTRDLTAEAVEGASLAFEGVHYVHGGDGLPLGVLRVSDRVPDHVLQKHLQYPAGLFINQTRYALDPTSAGQTPDGGLGDTLDIVTQNLTMALSAPLPQSFTTFASSRHDNTALTTFKTATETPRQFPYMSGFRTELKTESALAGTFI